VNGFKSGGAVTVSTISYSYAIKFTNFPVVMMIRSCNILSVVLVGVLFSGVKDTTLKLGRRKIVIAALATSGMIIFKVFDPNTSNSTHETEIIGISLMIASLLADGFLPDFQAVIKSVYKPHAIVMLESVNKWAAILCLTFSIATGHLIPMMTFILSHQKLLVDLLLIGILSSGGQFFVYYLAMVFKQHIVPLIVATRKIFTVGLSILYYNHGISSMQLLGLLLVFGISIYEFKT
jgi:UDP-galactose transporter B1